MTDEKIAQLKQATREANEAIQGMRDATREAKAVLAEVKEAAQKSVDAYVMPEVEKCVAALQEATNGAVEAATERVFNRFDGLTNLLLGTDRASLKTGELSIPELIEKRVARENHD
jgi:LPS O-antigen subunit length determinant protein (WzzB/FepE family)